MQHGGGFLANVVFTFGEADKEGGNETLWTRFIFNVGSSITVFIYGGCKYLDVVFSLVTVHAWRV